MLLKPFVSVMNDGGGGGEGRDRDDRDRDRHRHRDRQTIKTDLEIEMETEVKTDRDSFLANILSNLWIKLLIYNSVKAGTYLILLSCILGTLLKLSHSFIQGNVTLSTRQSRPCSSDACCTPFCSWNKVCANP